MSKWEKVKLVDVCDFQGGSQPPKEQWIEEAKDGYIRMLQIRDFTQNRVGKEEYIKISKNIKTCDDSDILIARYGASLGKILTGLSGAYNVAIMKTIPNIKILNKRYLRFFLLSRIFQTYIANVGSRAAQAGFNKIDLEDLFIPLPPLETQQQIAKTLDAAAELLDMRKQQLAELDNLIVATFYDMFGNPVINEKGWKICTFDDVAMIDTKMTKDFKKYAHYPHIGIDSIEKGTGAIVEYKLVKDSDIISGKYLFSDKHIIYSKIRPNLNKVALPAFEGVCSADAYPILPKENISNKFYLAHILRSDFFLNYILDFSGRTNIPKVNKQQLEGFQLPLPPIELQTQFANIVTKIEEQKALVKRSIDETQHLFDSLMSEYFE